MYPVKLGFEEALKRINALLKNHHDAEALVTSVFTLEKLMRRGLRSAVLARGFTSKHADVLLGRKGFQDLRELWPLFDRQHRTLPSLVDNKHWQHVARAVEMRNHLVHGQKVYNLDECKTYARHVLNVLKNLHKSVCTDYENDPWAKLTARKRPQLNWLSQS